VLLFFKRHSDGFFYPLDELVVRLQVMKLLKINLLSESLPAIYAAMVVSQYDLCERGIGCEHVVGLGRDLGEAGVRVAGLRGRSFCYACHMIEDKIIAWWLGYGLRIGGLLDAYVVDEVTGRRTFLDRAGETVLERQKLRKAKFDFVNVACVIQRVNIHDDGQGNFLQTQYVQANIKTLFVESRHHLRKTYALRSGTRGERA